MAPRWRAFEPARVDTNGRLMLLDEQDRSRWDRAQIDDGLAIVNSLSIDGSSGPYAIQAAIASQHMQASEPAATDWGRIAGLYSMLGVVAPSPVVELNRAVAVAMAYGPDEGLKIIELIETGGQLSGYHLMWSSKADLLRRLGRNVEARTSYIRARELAGADAEREFLERRIAEVSVKEFPR